MNELADDEARRKAQIDMNAYTKPCVEDDDLTLQILSVHSLAANTNSSCVQDLKQSNNKCNKEFFKRTTCHSQCSVLSKPLPKCSHLYLRRIKGLNTGIKSVLVVEAEYSRATPLPAYILNKQMENCSCISVSVNSNCNCLNLLNRNKKGCVKSGNSVLKSKKGVMNNTNTCHIVKQCAPWSDTKLKNNSLFVETNPHEREFQDCESSDKTKQVQTLNPEVTNTKESFEIDVSKDDKCMTLLHNLTNIDRIYQLKEKLKQKEADLEKIRKNSHSWKQITA